MSYDEFFRYIIPIPELSHLFMSSDKKKDDKPQSMVFKTDVSHDFASNELLGAFILKYIFPKQGGLSIFYKLLISVLRFRRQNCRALGHEQHSDQQHRLEGTRAEPDAHVPQHLRCQHQGEHLATEG